MENTPPLPPPVPSFQPGASVPGLSLPRSFSWRRSVGVKLAVVGVLILLLQIPLLLVRDTLFDREQLRGEAVGEISRTWGGCQIVAGPMLAVPYTVVTRVPRETVTGDRVFKTEELREVKGTAYFLPHRFAADGVLETAVRYRGIFRTPVYVSTLVLEGGFQPDVGALGVENANFDWARSRVIVSVSDPHGFRTPPVWRQGEVEQVFAPGVPREDGLTVIEAPWVLADAGAARAPFRIELSLQGSERLALAPVGESNDVTLRAAWRDPSFDGAYLPAERSVGPDGFTARWATTHFGRGYPSAWVEQPGREGVRGHLLAQSAFGVTLATPVDTYRMVERSMKYALLFLVLVFAVYFLFEVTACIAVHPLQYGMVGGALVLFYLGFLALAEFVPVGLAYGAAAGAATVLIAGYSWSALGAGARSLIIGGGLAATYGYLYFMLQLQDYALLAGTAALFVLLGVAMWLTRRMGELGEEARIEKRGAGMAPRAR